MFTQTRLDTETQIAQEFTIADCRSDRPWHQTPGLQSSLSTAAVHRPGCGACETFNWSPTLNGPRRVPGPPKRRDPAHSTSHQGFQSRFNVIQPYHQLVNSAKITQIWSTMPVSHKDSRLFAFASQILSQTLERYLLWILHDPPWFGGFPPSRNTKAVLALESTSQGENSPLPQGRTRSGFHPTWQHRSDQPLNSLGCFRIHGKTWILQESIGSACKVSHKPTLGISVQIEIPKTDWKV